MTAAIVGSVAYPLPPACTVVIVNGLTYQQCGSTWYQPQYCGSTVQYVVVAPLRGAARATDRSASRPTAATQSR